VAPEDLPSLFHQLNNQLGVILANAELLERRLSDDHRSRAAQLVSSAVDAIATAQRIRRLAEAAQSAVERAVPDAATASGMSDH
jgi:adenylate kinase